MTMPVTPPTSVPSTRSILVGASAAMFAYCKDPQDMAWYSVDFGEPLSEVTSPVLSDTSEGSITAEAQVADGTNIVLLWIEGGTDGDTYSIGLTATTVAGDVLNRTVRLKVLDL